MWYLYSLGALGAFSPNPCLRFVKSDSAFPNGQNGRHFLEQWLCNLERSGPISIHHIFCPYFFSSSARSARRGKSRAPNRESGPVADFGKLSKQTIEGLCDQEARELAPIDRHCKLPFGIQFFAKNG